MRIVSAGDFNELSIVEFPRQKVYHKSVEGAGIWVVGAEIQLQATGYRLRTFLFPTGNSLPLQIPAYHA
jgi:hypothetical protein